MEENQNRPLKYFTLEEMKCKHCGDIGTGISLMLMYKLDQLREMVGHPIYVTSGYRCPEHNRAVGGAEHSYHTRGMAADIYCESVAPEILAALAAQVRFSGIGIYPARGFIHVDVRDLDPGTPPARWVDRK